jgi:hypothetical protein
MAEVERTAEDRAERKRANARERKRRPEAA